jgi:hypothetical protein
MFIGIGGSIPQIADLPGPSRPGGGTPTPTGDFLALESALTDLILLESGDKIELETA